MSIAHMSLTALLVFLIIGGIAGWLAGLLVRGRGFGIIGDVILGVIGSFLGAWIFRHLHVAVPGGQRVGEFVTAIVGAGVLVLILRLIRR